MVLHTKKLDCCRAETEWLTKVHARGTCASYGICGHRKDGDVLNCANNTVAQPISSSVAQKLQVITSSAAHDSWHRTSSCAKVVPSCQEQWDALVLMRMPSACVQPTTAQLTAGRRLLMHNCHRIADISWLLLSRGLFSDAHHASRLLCRPGF